ncbi:MAG: Lycopene cyclase [Ignavibacteriae bacterium]|nr:MAG: Lycopene cyclase [Ignavibacteriota bacterium]
MFLYASLLCISILVPLVLSCDKKLKFYQNWKYLFPALFLVGFFFIIFDIYFTQMGIWGFNSRYTLNIKIFGLPIEEFLFFIIIPYASIFLHESIVLYFPRVRLKNIVSSYLTKSLILLSSFIIILNSDKIYTIYAFSILIITLLLSSFDKFSIVQNFYLTFLIILVPFIAINGILTGSFIE